MYLGYSRDFPQTLVGDLKYWLATHHKHVTQKSHLIVLFEKINVNYFIITHGMVICLFCKKNSESETDFISSRSIKTNKTQALISNECLSPTIVNRPYQQSIEYDRTQ